jgi:hypothetical protein
MTATSHSNIISDQQVSWALENSLMGLSHHQHSNASQSLENNNRWLQLVALLGSHCSLLD